MEGGREELLRNEIHQRTDRQMGGRERELLRWEVKNEERQKDRETWMNKRTNRLKKTWD